MRPDMKNFSEVTDINTADQLAIHIELAEHNDPVYSFTVNGIEHVGILYVDLLSLIHFKCTVQSGAIDVVKITVNGHEVMPLYQHVANPATSWVTAGWELQIQQPFYTWYHQTTGQGWIA
jgi:hypothetical protein